MDPAKLFLLYSKFQYISDHLYVKECKKSAYFKSYDFECCMIPEQYAIMILGNIYAQFLVNLSLVRYDANEGMGVYGNPLPHTFLSDIILNLIIQAKSTHRHKTRKILIKMNEN